VDPQSVSESAHLRVRESRNITAVASAFVVGPAGDLGPDTRSHAGRALDVKAPVECLDAIGEFRYAASPARIRSADAVIDDLNEHVSVPADDPCARDRRLRVFCDVGQGFSHEIVRGCLHPGGQPLVGKAGELDGQRGAACETL
jgi:hypothetical protein